ncbi:hypothetical protein [Gallintestinimicrobium sp.]|jgi:hypothetical protein|uniref:hypothetical protein n=1 Tax=Gallintestinimicrobium sp. TaxID=2981655 RepID=UPI003AF934DF
MEPITREEYYLAKIAGTYEGNTPEPVTIEEYYLATMAGDYSGNTPQPVTRLQYYMAKVAGVWGGSIPAPVTRLEYYWAAIASGEGKVFPPVTREEHFLVLVADAYSVVLTVVTGNPALLENSKGNRGLESLTLYGKSTQVSTTGAQLLPFEVGEKREGLEVFKDGIAISGARKNDIYAVGRSGMGNESSYDDFPLLASGEYYIYSDSASVNLFVVAFRNGINITLGGSMKGVATKIKVMDGDKFRIFLRLEEDFNGKVKAMISKTQPTASNYEPYTGGKPSPSQEYPQEIESVGQDGEIEVKTLGANLFDASTALKTQIDAGLLHINDSGEVVLNGTFGTNNRNFYITLKPGVYCLTGGAIWHIIASKDSVFDRILTIDEETTYHCYISNGTYNEVVSNPMINAGSTALPYEPYKPAQTLIIPTPNGLSGIPVSSGGNYTDADGQQWVCDEVDFKKGVYVQRVATETPKAKWKNFEETADVPNRYCISGALVNRYRDGSTKCLISHGIYANWGIAPGWALNSTTFYYHPKEDVTKEEAKEQILGFINSANPLTFLGQLETPIEKPLTTEQLATYKALRTYSPTTTVANDAEAGMSVGYAKMK